MSRTRRFIAGVRLGLLAQMLPALAGILMTPFLLARVGHSSLGLWLIATQIVTYLSLLDLGVLSLVPREVSLAVGRSGADGASPISTVVGQGLYLLFLQLPLVALVAVGIWVALPDQWASLRGVLAVILVAFVACFPLRIFAATLFGLQEFGASGALSLGGWAAGTCLTLGGVLAGFELYALAAGWVLQQLVQGIGGLVWLWRFRPEALPRGLPRSSANVTRSWLKRSLWLVVSQLSVMLLTGSDVLLVGGLLGPESVLVYACTIKLVQLFASQVNLVALTAQPALSELRGRNDQEALVRVIHSLLLVTLLASGAAAAAIVTVNRGFVLWWLSPAEFGGLRLTLLAVALMVLRHFNLALGQVVFVFGHERVSALVSFANGLVSVAVTALAIRWLGLWAVPLGGLVGLLVVAIPSNIVLVAREFGGYPKHHLAGLAAWALRALPVLAGGTMLAYLWIPSSVVTLGMATLLALGAYGVLVAPLALRPPLAAYVRPRLVRIASVLGLRLGPRGAGP